MINPMTAEEQDIRLFDRSMPTAMWRQIKALLREEIGQLAPGDRLATEAELCRRFDVSRITVRQALDSLVGDGLLVRTAGRGTFVADPLAAEALELDTPLIGPQLYDAPGITLSVTSREVLYADARLQHWFGVGADALVHKIRRVARQRRAPFAYEVHHVPERYAPGLTERRLVEHDLAKVLEDRYGLAASRVEHQVQAAAADHWRATWLGVPAGAPVLLVQQRRLLADGALYHHTRTFYRHDAYQLHFATRSEANDR
jgi:GntR family transcriptional regulator